MRHYNFHCFKDGVELADVQQKKLPSAEAALDYAKVVGGTHRTLMAQPKHT